MPCSSVSLQGTAIWGSERGNLFTVTCWLHFQTCLNHLIKYCNGSPNSRHNALEEENLSCLLVQYTGSKPCRKPITHLYVSVGPSAPPTALSPAHSQALISRKTECAAALLRHAKLNTQIHFLGETGWHSALPSVCVCMCVCVLPAQRNPVSVTAVCSVPPCSWLRREGVKQSHS